jgi:peroxiredoxin
MAHSTEDRARLQPQLDAITEQTRRLVQAERLEPADRAIAEALPLEAKIAQPGQRLQHFALTDATGRIISSADVLALGLVVLKFFRGRWDPYCSTELEAWRDLYPELRSRDAFLLALSPQTVRQNDFLAGQHSLPFPLLRDERCAVATSLGLTHVAPDYLQQYYRSIMINIPFINGEDSWTLPLPATVVVDRGGIIRYIEAHANFRVRPEPAAALDVLDSLQGL